MTKIIRKLCFETNSSSTHSISIADGVEVMDVINPVNGVVKLVIGESGQDEFGWEFETYTSPIDKAMYALLYTRDWARGNEEKFKQILHDVIKQQTCADEVVLDYGEKSELGNYYNIGYIDHQSVEDGVLDYLFETPELLRRFIFDKNSVLETSNDN